MKTTSDPTGDPGEQIRLCRRERKWTLAELARRTGLPISTLSRLETGRVAASFDKLQRVSAAFGLDIAGLLTFAGGADPASGATRGRRTITRAEDGRPVTTPHYLHHYLATDFLNKRMTPIIADLTARSIEAFGDLIRHEGEEFTFVLEGEVRFHCEFYEPVTLACGDSLYFDSTMGHAYIASGPGPCRILCLSSSTVGLAGA